MMRHLVTVAFFGWICRIVYLADTAQGCCLFDLGQCVPHGDKLGHVGLFGMLAMLLNHSLGYRKIPLGGGSLPWGAVLVMGFALAEECTQRFLPHRTFDPWDVLADLCGVALASLIPLAWLKYRTAAPA